METYKTYQEAKIAHPESDIYTNGMEFDTDMTFDPEHITAVKCNPADYCMTVEKFLNNGYELVDRDIVINHDGKVTIVRNDPDWNMRDCRDNARYILRAAVFEDSAMPLLQSLQTKKVVWENGSQCRYVHDTDREYIYIGEHPHGDGHYVFLEEKGVTYIANGHLIEPKSDYDKEMREAMEKIAASCGRSFGVDVGYEDLPELVESIIQSKKKTKRTKESTAVDTLERMRYTWNGGELWKPPVGKAPDCVSKFTVEYEKVTDSIFNLKHNLEAGDLFFGDGNLGFEVIDSELDLMHKISNNNVFRKVEKEITWQDEFLDILSTDGCHVGKGFFEGGVIIDGAVSKETLLKAIHHVTSITDKPLKREDK